MFGCFGVFRWALGLAMVKVWDLGLLGLKLREDQMKGPT